MPKRQAIRLWTRSSGWPEYWPLLETKHIYLPTSRPKPIDPHCTTLGRWILNVTSDGRIQGAIYDGLVRNLIEAKDHLDFLEALPSFSRLTDLHIESNRDGLANAWNATGFDLGYDVPLNTMAPFRVLEVPRA